MASPTRHRQPGHRGHGEHTPNRCSPLAATGVAGCPRQGGLMRRIARTVSVLWWPVVLLVGLPVGLLHLPGRPALPRHLPTSAQWAQLGVAPMTRGAVLTVLVGLGWLAWAIRVWAGRVDVRRWVATVWRRLPQLRLPGPLQG